MAKFKLDTNWFKATDDYSRGLGSLWRVDLDDQLTRSVRENVQSRQAQFAKDPGSFVLPNCIMKKGHAVSQALVQ